MNKVVVALLFIAGLSCLVLAKTECSALLKCKECEDETHCKSCPDGYKLDDKKVCRYDCAAKFGTSCTSCTEQKCLCPLNQEWDMKKGQCVAIDCPAGSACDYCGKGYDLVDINGTCKTCAEVFGAGCLACSWSRCLTPDTGYTICGSMAVSEESSGTACMQDCASLFPGCTQCDSENSVCLACANGTELDNGCCKFKKENCGAGKKLARINGVFTCVNSCTVFDPDCGTCSGHGCTRCKKTGYTPSADGKCMSCNATFANCALCTADGCTRCGNSLMTLTPNGCLNQNAYVKPSESNGGLIAGIVIACIVFIVIVVLAVYCIITSNAKKGQVDPAVYEDDFEFKSMSVL